MRIMKNILKGMSPKMKCPKCGTDLTKEDIFCPECGHKVKKEKQMPEQMEEKVHFEKKITKSNEPKKWLLLGAIVLAILIIASVIIFAVPMTYTATQQYVETVPYDAQESYSEKEPYSATETYYESESYHDEECSYVYPKYNKDQDFEWIESGRGEISCTITNFEYLAVTFLYTFNSFDSNKDLKDSYGPRSVTVGSGQTTTKSGVLDATSPGTYSCFVEAQKIETCKTVTKFRDVPKTRTVTKYKDETKSRTVTKYKDEYDERSITKKATLFNIWTGNVKYYYAVGE